MKFFRKAYIYGAGEYALSEFYRISNSYDILGIVVSEISGHPNKIMNTPVLSIDDVNDYDAFFIICSSYECEIKNNLLNKGFHNFCGVTQLISEKEITGDKIIKESKVIEVKNDNIRRVIDLTDIDECNVIKDVIVSLTSFPERFSNLDLVIKSLKKQIWQPEKIILWISYSDYEKIPLKVSNLQDEQFEIRQCADLRSYKKLIPALEQFLGKTIVTADDDLYYWPNWLKKLVEKHRQHPDAIVAHRVHRINQNRINSYLDWEHAAIGLDSQTISPWNFPVGVAGVLYPWNCFHSDVLNRDLFLQLCPAGDDIWFYWMFRLNGYSAVGTGTKDCLVSVDSYMTSNLYDQNMFQGGNDRQIENMINQYGFIGV